MMRTRGGKTARNFACHSIPLAAARARDKISTTAAKVSLKLTIIGNTRRIFHNGTLIATYVDSFYVDGELAIAYFTRPGGNSAHYCIKQLTVTPL